MYAENANYFRWSSFRMFQSIEDLSEKTLRPFNTHKKNTLCNNRKLITMIFYNACVTSILNFCPRFSGTYYWIICIFVGSALESGLWAFDESPLGLAIGVVQRMIEFINTNMDITDLTINCGDWALVTLMTMVLGSITNPRSTSKLYSILERGVITACKNDTSIVDEIVRESISPSRWRSQEKLWGVCLRARGHQIRGEKSSFGGWGRWSISMVVVRKGC